MNKNIFFKAEKVESFDDLKNLYKRKPWMLALHILVGLLLAIIINSCTAPSDTEKLKQNYSQELWQKAMAEKSKGYDIFEENGHKHISVDVGDYVTINRYRFNVEHSLEVARLNKEIDGDAVILATNEFINKYGESFRRGVIVSTFPLSEARKINFDEITGSGLIFANASKVLIMSQDLKLEIAKKCLDRGWMSSIPILCKATTS